MKKKTLFKLFLPCLILSAFSIFLSNKLIEKNAKGNLYFKTKNIPKNKVGLILGTSKKTRNGNINGYYKYRLDAAIELFKSGKIEYLVVSGDNSSTNYDEPTDFKEDLIKAGIPENKIFLDYAGFRTLDSVVRIKEIFG